MKARTSIIIETLLQLSLTLSGLYVVLMSGPAGSLVWCLIAATYVIFRLVRLRVPGRDRTPTARSIRTRLAFALLASAVGLTGALNAVITPADYGFDEVAVPMILLAWAVLHFGYSDVYRDEAAMALARGETPAIEFAGDATPSRPTTCISPSPSASRSRPATPASSPRTCAASPPGTEC